MTQQVPELRPHLTVSAENFRRIDCFSEDLSRAPYRQGRQGFIVVVSVVSSKSLLPFQKGEKVADRPDEGVIRSFCRLEILNGVARTGKLTHAARRCR